MKRIILTLAGLALLLGGVERSQAQPFNQGPPPGAILDLNGTAIPHSYTKYSVDFMATSSSTNLSFAFRDDPAFLFLDDVSVVNKKGGGNLLTNGGFESGIAGNNAPVGWTYLNNFGATFAGVVAQNNPNTGSFNYYDGAVQAYDGITQAIATTSGDIYTVEFWLSENSGNTTFSRLSTNGDITDTGGNGIDLLVYAGVIPQEAPEPASMILLGIGVVGMAGYGWRRRGQVKAESTPAV